MSSCNLDSSLVTGNKSQKLRALITGDKTAFVFFYSPSCPHCQTMLKYFNKHRETCKRKNKNDVVLVIVNLDTSRELFEEYKVYSFPQVFIYKKGRKIGHVLGADEEELAEQFAKVGL